MKNSQVALTADERRADQIKQLWFFLFAVYLCFAVCFYVPLGPFFLKKEAFISAEPGRPVSVSDYLGNYQIALVGRRSVAGAHYMYDPDFQLQVANEIISPLHLDGGGVVSPYPPTVYLATFPLSLFSVPQSFILFTLSSALSLVAACLLLGSWGKWGKFTTAMFIVGAFMSYPVWRAVLIGQLSLFLLLGIVLFYRQLRRGKFLQAAVATAVGFFKLQYLPYVGLIGLVVGKVRYVLELLSSYLVLATVCILLYGVQNTISYPRMLMESQLKHSLVTTHPEAMQNLRGVLLNWTPFTDGQLMPVVYAVAIASLLGIGFVWWRLDRSKRLDDINFMLAAAISVLIMLMTSPHTHLHDFTLLVFPCGMILSCLLDSSVRATLQGKIMRILIVTFPIAGWCLGLFFDHFKFIFCWTLAMSVCASIVLWQRATRSIPQSQASAEQ